MMNVSLQVFVSMQILCSIVTWIHLQTFYALDVKKVMSVCFAFGLSRFNVTDGDSGMKGMRDKDSAEDAVVRPNRTEESRGQSLLHLHRKESVGLTDRGY